MEYQQIVSITGLSGLYEVINSKNDGAIVRSLEDQTTKFVSSRLHNVSYLETIEVYTQEDNVNLVEIFKAMHSNSGNLPSEKDAKAVKQYFEKVFPQLDFERVYHSDMKKMIRWFQILQSSNIELKISEPEAEEEPLQEVDETPKKKSDTKKAEKVTAEEKSNVKKSSAKSEKEEATTKKPAKKSTKSETEVKETPKKSSKK